MTATTARCGSTCVPAGPALPSSPRPADRCTGTACPAGRDDLRVISAGVPTLQRANERKGLGMTSRLKKGLMGIAALAALALGGAGLAQAGSSSGSENQG